MKEKEVILNKSFKWGPKCIFVWPMGLFLTQTLIYINIHKLCVLFSPLLGITNTISHLLIYIKKIYTYSRMKISINIYWYLNLTYILKNYISGYFDKNISDGNYWKFIKMFEKTFKNDEINKNVYIYIYMLKLFCKCNLYR